ncbi:hypothetical protein CCP2SC5_1360002 [Azospirillaceae bacterium]
MASILLKHLSGETSNLSWIFHDIHIELKRGKVFLGTLIRVLFFKRISSS